MKFKSLLIAAVTAALSCTQAFAQATILPPGETCFSALSPTSGGPGNTGTGFIGLLGTITGGSSYTNGTYGGVALTGGSGSGATANVTVSGGVVTAVAVVSPGQQYVVGDTLSAAAASIGGTGAGFSVPVTSIALNYSLAGGSVSFYIPNTLTFKQTWKDSGEVILNQNPVPLDANGCALIYGAGVYRMILKDSLGDTVYDQITASTGPAGIFWAGAAGGTPNAITVTDTAFAYQDGATIQFRAKSTNSGPTTITVSGGTSLSVVKDTSSGPAALSGGEFGPSNTPMVTYDATNAEFHLVNPSATTSSSASSSTSPPQGYLNLVGAASGSVVQTGDVVAATTVYYSPYVGNQIPIWNGSSFATLSFSELTAALTSASSPGSAVQDNCVFSNNGVPTLVTGPSWTSSTNRGTGAGTAQLSRLNGIWVNAVSIVAYNGISSYTIPANQCTYVGSISLDGAGGQVSAYRTAGQSRTFGVWNAYNRRPIILQVQDSTSTWVDGGGNRWVASNGNVANAANVFIGLPEEEAACDFTQMTTVQPTNASNVGMQIGIGINVASSPASGSATGAFAQNNTTATSGFVGSTLKAKATVTPFIGRLNVFAIQNPTFASGATNVTYYGGSFMLLTVQYQG